MFGFKRTSVQFLVFLSWCLQEWTLGNVYLWYIFGCGVCLAGILCVLTYDHDYWADRGIFSPPAWPLVGHILSVLLFREQGGICFLKIYNKYRHLRFLGTHQFFQRTLVILDPALIRRVCVTDFSHFVDRGFFFNRDVDPLAGSVLFLRGQEWRRLRAKISPIFSPNKLKGMFPIIENTAQEFVKRVSTLPASGDVVVDSERLLGGYTADAIVPCAFGVKSHVMDDEKDPFAVALHAFYEMTPYNVFEKTMRQFWPAFPMFFRMKIIPQKTHDFFYNIVTSVLRDREKESGVPHKRGDFIDMMMALRNDDRNGNRTDKDDDHVEITDMVISANAFIIFLGGFETTSSTLAFLLLELAAHPEVQEKLRREIMDVVGERELTYEMLQELTYMDMVIQETLRLYPPFPNIQRMCTRDYVIPETGHVIEKGTVVLFPTLAIQRDEQYFKDATWFRPERWRGPAPPRGVYMPFGDGPRVCIGKRFAWIQMKVCVSWLLRVVRVSPAPSAPPRAPPPSPGPRDPDPRDPDPRDPDPRDHDPRDPDPRDPDPRDHDPRDPDPRTPAPHAPDPRSPLSLHPWDSKITISLIR